MLCNYEVHPAANCFPLMDRGELERLKADILENDQKVAAMIYQGYLIDGRNRKIACQELAIPLKTMVVDDDLVGGDVIAFVRSINECRRHLTASQRAAVADAIAELYASEAPPRTGGITGQGGGSAGPCPVTGGDRTSVAVKRAAAEMGVSPATVARVRSARKGGCQEVADAMRDGHLTAKVAKDLVKAVPDKERQKAILAEAAVASPQEGSRFVREAIAAKAPANGSPKASPTNIKAAEKALFAMIRCFDAVGLGDKYHSTFGEMKRTLETLGE